MTQPLNGWYRLWILVSLVWLCFILYQGNKHFPGNETRFIDIGPYSCLFTPQDGDGESIKAAIEKVAPELEDHPGSFPCNKLPDAIDQSGKHSEFMAAYTQDLHDRRISYLEKGAIYYFGPMIALWLFGFLVAWVIRGFRGEERSEHPS